MSSHRATAEGHRAARAHIDQYTNHNIETRFRLNITMRRHTTHERRTRYLSRASRRAYRRDRRTLHDARNWARRHTICQNYGTERHPAITHHVHTRLETTAASTGSTCWPAVHLGKRIITTQVHAQEDGDSAADPSGRDSTPSKGGDCASATTLHFAPHPRPAFASHEPRRACIASTARRSEEVRAAGEWRARKGTEGRGAAFGGPHITRQLPEALRVGL